MQNSSASLLTALVTAVVVFLFASAWFFAVAARNTLKAAKGAVGPARKTFWGSVGRVIRLGLVAAVLGLALIAWSVRDVSQADEQKPVPAPSASHR